MSNNQPDIFKRIKSDAPLVFAHRGASADAPENTMAAFRLAKEYGANGIELDVHLSADGHLVIIHDYTLNRTARMPDGKKLKSETPVNDLTLAQLRKYDVGISFSNKYAGEKIPTLREVMDFIGPDVLLNIEIKADMEHPYRGISAALALFLYEYSQTKSINNVTVSSFHPLALNCFRRAACELKMNIPIALFYGTNREVPWYLRRGQGALLCNPDILQPLYSDLAKKKNLSGKNRPIIAWTINDKNADKELIDKNIAGIITDNPKGILKLKAK
ncbi:MAG: hypothetical protein FWF97_01950 [Alphaproteobacteria bacterium]|nr:hypothetical protein [Alphaproteobacteria bacterium]